MMKHILIINALIWAAVLLVASYLYRDTESFIYLLSVIIVGFTLQNGLTSQAMRKLQAGR